MTNRHQQLKKLNQEPINKVALDFLKQAAPDWQAEGQSLGMVSLMLWALAEGKIGGKEVDNLTAQVLALDQGSPEWAMRFLLVPKGTDEDGVVLDAEELRNQETAEDAAAILLETLHMMMAARRP
jgi:hypothetical protein